MDIKVYGENVEVTLAIKEHVIEKVSHLKLPEKVANIEVRLNHVKTTNIAKININCLGQNIHIEEKDDDLYAAIDKLIHRTQRNLVKFKEKNNIHLY